jgi:hypothetical protein
MINHRWRLLGTGASLAGIGILLWALWLGWRSDMRLDGYWA